MQDAPGRCALVEDLQPWLQLLFRRPPKLTLADDGCVGAAVVLACQVDVTAALSVSPGVAPHDHALAHATLAKLREAIDLVYTIIRLDPSFLWSRGVPTLTFMAEDPLARQALMNGKPCTLCVTLVARRLMSTALLELRLHRYFIRALDTTMLDLTFVRVRVAVKKVLQSTRPRPRLLPICLRFSFEELSPSALVIEDYMTQLIQFITSVQAVQPTVDEEKDTQHVQLTIDRVEFSLKQFLITHQIAQVIKQQLACVSAGFAVCEKVRVDPRMVQCSREDLVEFLNALASLTTSGLEIDTGPSNDETIGHVDRDGEDRSSVCTEILDVIASCDRARRVSVEGLLRVFPSARRVIYRAMIEHLFSRAGPLVVIEKINLREPDATMLREEHVAWRERNPVGRLTVKAIVVKVNDRSGRFLDAIIDVLDDAEEVVLRDTVTAPRPNTRVPTILNKFQSLRKILVEGVTIPSMDIFLAQRSCPLEDLGICDAQLEDRDSFGRFFQALKRPTSPIARSLRRLLIWMNHAPNYTFQITTDEANEVAEALQANKLLASFICSCHCPREHVDSISSSFMETKGRVVPAKLEDSKLITERTRRVAFLSVMQYPPTCLPTSVVEDIFAFAAPCVARGLAIHLEGN